MGAKGDLIPPNDGTKKDLVVPSMKFHQTNNYIISVIYIQLQGVAGFFKNHSDYRKVIRDNLGAVNFESHVWVKSQEVKTEIECDKDDSDIQELLD